MNLTVFRRKKLLTLLQEFVLEQTSQGVPPKGLEQAFAAKIEISPSLLSQIKKARPIGDRLARQIENHCGKAPEWLDEDGGLPLEPDPAEEAFVEVARLAWKQANSREKRALMRELSLRASARNSD